MWIDYNSPLICNKCGHKWKGEILQDVAISVWIAHVKALHCPQCGADWKAISFGQEPDETVRL